MSWWRTRNGATSSRVAVESVSCAFALPGRGKSGGVRVIYYWLRDDGQIYMLLIYPKSKKDDLT
jgi:hypothetical protein